MNTSHNKLILLIACASLVFCAILPSLRADDSAMHGEGGDPQPMTEHPSITMVREDVSLNPATEQVKAKFVFKNNGPATTVLMGFPEESSGDGTQDTTKRETAPGNGLHSFVDGKPAEVSWMVRKSDENGEEHSTIWWTKRVHFAAGQTRIVVDNYAGGGGGVSTGNQFFTYVLISGASWKGPIGIGVVTMDLSGLPYGPFDMEPTGWVRHGSTAVLRFSNLKPTQDIFVGWFPAYTNVWINGASVFDGRLKAAGLTPNADAPGTQMFTWDADFWTPVTSRRRGSDVWLPAKAAAHWLGGKFVTLNGDKQVKIIYGDQWIIASDGSSVLSTSSGPFTMPYPCTHEKPANGQDGSATMVALSTVVKALGGIYAYDSDKDKVTITIPPPN